MTTTGRAPAATHIEARRTHVTQGMARTGSLAAALLLGFLALAVVQHWTWLQTADDTIDTSIHRWALENPWAVDVARRLGDIGDVGPSTVLVLLTLVVLLVARRWWTALTVAVTAALAPWLTDLLKPVIDRPRPTWIVSFAVEPGPSFPSGHATGGIAVWCVCGVALASLIRDPSWAALFVLPWILLGIAIGISRLVLGVHWPSDVLAGWCVALAVLGLAASLFVLPSSIEAAERPTV